MGAGKNARQANSSLPPPSRRAGSSTNSPRPLPESTSANTFLFPSRKNSVKPSNLRRTWRSGVVLRNKLPLPPFSASAARRLAENFFSSSRRPWIASNYISPGAPEEITSARKAQPLQRRGIFRRPAGRLVETDPALPPKHNPQSAGSVDGTRIKVLMNLGNSIPHTSPSR